MARNREYVRLGLCLRSAMDNYNNRIDYRTGASHLPLGNLEDIEVDLEAALKTVRALLHHKES